MGNNERKIVFDILKGVAIISVVVYHSIPHFVKAHNIGYFQPIMQFQDQFQIPLFLIVSGYFFFASLHKESLVELFKRKIFRLLIPYFVVGSLLFLSKALYLSIKGLYNLNLYDYLKSSITIHAHLTINGTGLGFGPMWFLLMLFIITSISFFTLKKNIIAEAIYFMFILYSILFVKEIPISPDYNMESLCYFIIPFQTGFLIRKYNLLENSFVENKRNSLILILISTFLIIVHKFLEIEHLIHSKTIVISLLIFFPLYLLSGIFYSNLRKLQVLGKKSMIIYLFHAPYFTYLGLVLTHQINQTHLYYNVLSIILMSLVCIIGPLMLEFIYENFLKSKIKILNDKSKIINK